MRVPQTEDNANQSRQKLKTERKRLFELFLKNPMHTPLAVEIKVQGALSNSAYLFSDSLDRIRPESESGCGMAANSNSFKDHPEWPSGLVPVVSVGDLARVWQIQENEQKLAPGRDVVIGLDEYQRACSKDADIVAVCTRSEMLRTLLKLREAGTLDIPHVHHGAPDDAVFGAMATLPMSAAEHGVWHDGFPFQVEELFRLIKEYGD